MRPPRLAFRLTPLGSFQRGGTFMRERQAYCRSGGPILSIVRLGTYPIRSDQAVHQSGTHVDEDYIYGRQDKAKYGEQDNRSRGWR